MQIKFIDWRSDHEVEQERLAMTYHENSNHHPQLEVLTRARMKMLQKLFAQMNVDVTTDKRYFSTTRLPLHAEELKYHPAVQTLLQRLGEQQGEEKPFADVQQLGLPKTAQVDALDLYVLSRHEVTQRYELFYYNRTAQTVERIKETETITWEEYFQLSLGETPENGAFFIAANISRSHKLFGERGYRYSLLEGGRLTERLLVCSHDSGWNLIPVMTFYDSKIHDLLGLDGHYEVVLSCLMIHKEG